MTWLEIGLYQVCAIKDETMGIWVMDTYPIDNKNSNKCIIMQLLLITACINIGILYNVKN